MLDLNWRPVVGHEGRYEVSECGQVRSLDRTIIDSRGRRRSWKGRVLKPTINGSNGRREVRLGSKTPPRLVAHLVAEAFIGSRPTGYLVLHNDGNKTNDHANNLRYGTNSDNQLDRVAHGRNHWALKTHCPRGHAHSPEYSRPGKRTCRECRLKGGFYARKRGSNGAEVR